MQRSLEARYSTSAFNALLYGGLVGATFWQEVIRYREPMLSLCAVRLRREDQQQEYPTKEFRLLQSPR